MKKTDKNYTEFANELTNIWNGSAKMVEFCTKEVSQVVKIGNGYLIPFYTPSIEKEFCFGYSTCGQGMDWDEAINTERNARNDMERYFFEHNVNRVGYDRMIDSLQDKNNTLYLGTRFHLDNNGVIKKWHCTSKEEIESHPWMYGEVEKSENQEADKAIILNALKEEKTKFEKRLQTWWKRYGADKIRTWTYWVDE